MDYKLIPLSQLDESDIRQLADLHHSVMHTLLSDLGSPLVLRYYQIAQVSSDVIGICAVSPAGDVLGWAMGSPNPDKLNVGLRAPLLRFLLQMFKLILTRPFVLLQLMFSVLSSGSPVPEGAIELTYIGVDSHARKRGLGSALLNAFIHYARETGYRSVLLSVEAENEEALAMYTGAGFKTINMIVEGRFKRHRMELML